MEKNMLGKLKRFFEIDKEVKHDMYNLCPPFIDSGISNEVLVNYWDNAYKSLKEIFEDFKELDASFNEFGSFLPDIKKLEEATMNFFSSCGTSLDKLKEFYEVKVSNMSDELINTTKEECVGYSINSFPVKSLNKVKTINEMLHVMHSYIVNNDLFYQSVDVLSQKTNEEGYPIILRGEDNNLGKNLFNFFPVDMEAGYTDIISLSDKKALLMIRDRGHALTIDVEEKNDKLHINYFIPKLCNFDLINGLPGVRKVDPEKDNIFSGTTGSFVIKDKSNFDEFYDFVSKVPTDEDMNYSRK